MQATAVPAPAVPGTTSSRGRIDRLQIGDWTAESGPVPIQMGARITACIEVSYRGVTAA